MPATTTKQPEMTDGMKQQAEAMAAMNALTPEHRMLAEHCGTFDVKLTAIMPTGESMVMNTVATREMILGGRFMREVSECKEGPMPYQTICLTGFNPDAEGGARFEVTRISSMGNATMPETGTYDPVTKILTTSGQHDMNGMKGKVRVVHAFLDGGREKADVYLSFEGYSEQFKGTTVPEHKAMTLEYTKRR